MKLFLLLVACAAAQEPPVFQGYTPEVLVCLGSCPTDARCQHKLTGACTYAAPEADYEHDDNARRLADGDVEEGPEDEIGGEMAASQFYGEPSEFGCGVDFIDLACYRLGSNVVLWVTAAILFLSSMVFFWLAFHDNSLKLIVAKHGGFSSATQSTESVQLARLTSGIIGLISSFSYTTMALGYGFTVRCCDGRTFHYARFIEYLFTFPLIVYRIVDYTKAACHEKHFLYAMTILNIASLFIGSLVCGSDKWVFFGFSMSCGLPVVIWLIHSFPVFSKGENLNDDAFSGVYTNIVILFVIVVPLYLTLWVLSQGTNTICAHVEAICYAVLDVFTKAVLGFMMVQMEALHREKIAPSGGSML